MKPNNNLGIVSVGLELNHIIINEWPHSKNQLKNPNELIYKSPYRKITKLALKPVGNRSTLKNTT